MKCPNDGTEMEEGILAQNGTLWAKNSDPVSLGGTKVWAYRCSKCGKVELTSEPDKKEDKKDE